MKENKDKMIEMLQKGFSYQMVGNVYGVSRQRIHEICGKAPIMPEYGVTKSELRRIVKSTKLTPEQHKKADKMVKASVRSLNKSVKKSIRI